MTIESAINALLSNLPSAGTVNHLVNAGIVGPLKRLATGLGGFASGGSSHGSHLSGVPGGSEGPVGPVQSGKPGEPFARRIEGTDTGESGL